jgi:hypothetical protein
MNGGKTDDAYCARTDDLASVDDRGQPRRIRRSARPTAPARRTGHAPHNPRSLTTLRDVTKRRVAVAMTNCRLGVDRRVDAGYRRRRRRTETAGPISPISDRDPHREGDVRTTSTPSRPDLRGRDPLGLVSSGAQVGGASGGCRAVFGHGGTCTTNDQAVG